MLKNCFCLCSCVCGLGPAYVAYTHVTQLCSYIHRCVLEALHTWEWTCVHGVLPACVGFDPRTWDARQKPYFAHFHSFFYCFTSICNSNTLFLSFLHLKITVSFFLSSFFHQNTICLNFAWIMNLVSSFFLQSSPPYAGRESTNKVVERFNLLIPKTKGYIWEEGFKPVISLLLEKTTSATLS